MQGSVRVRVLGSTFFMAVLGTGSGCDHESPNDDAQANGGDACGKIETQVITDPTTVPPTFELSFDDVIGGASGKFYGTFAWGESGGSWISPDPGAETGLRMTVTHDGGEMRFVELSAHGDFPGQREGGRPCSNRMEIDAQLDFQTDDGRLIERVPITLVRESAVAAHETSFFHEIDFDASEGSLRITDFDYTDAEVTAVHLRGSFEGARARGELWVEVEGGKHGWSGHGSGIAANFASFAESTNSVCGGCSIHEYCHVSLDGGDVEGPSTYECRSVPDSCDAGSLHCDCLTAATCDAGYAACYEEIGTLTLECYDG